MSEQLKQRAEQRLVELKEQREHYLTIIGQFNVAIGEIEALLQEDTHGDPTELLPPAGS